MAEESGNIFISHIHEDDAELGAMKDLLAKGGFSVRDSSINSSRPNEAEDPEYIKSEILAPAIRWAGTCVVLVSPGTRDSSWVDWEIRYANKIGKRIVGVWAHGAKDCDVPAALKDYADAVVGWQTESIIDAIGGRINNWQTSEGQPQGQREIAHANC